MILVDTNAWVHHLRRRDAQLSSFLLQQRVRTCDVVIGELALGSGLPTDFVPDLRALPRLPSPSAADTLLFVDRHRRALAGSGAGWADVQIVLAAARAGARLYTTDRGVRKVCRAVGVPLG